MYPAVMLFPHIHWKTADNAGSILGTVKAPLHNKCISMYGFSSNQKHVRYRLTSSSVATGTNLIYIAYLYEKLTNL